MQISSRLSSRSIHVNQIQACRTLSNTRSIHLARSTISNVLMTKFILKNLVKFTAESEDDDVAQIFFDTLEQNIKKSIASSSFLNE
jgi:hypothetical protein